MVICTKSCDSLVKVALREQHGSLSVQRFVDILGLLQVDPNLQEQSIEAFVISSADVKSSRMATMFEQACAVKHPNAYLIYIDKERKANKYSSGFNGIDKVLSKPKAPDVAKAIYSVASQLSEKPKVESARIKVEELDPTEDEVSFDDITESYNEPVEDELDIFAELDSAKEEPAELSIPTQEPEEVEEVSEEDNQLAKRLRSAKEIVDVTQVMREVTAETVLSNLAKENAQYNILEDKLKELSANIYAVMQDNTIPFNERVSKARSLGYDKRYFNIQSNTLVERYVLDIIDALTGTMETAVNDLCARIEEQITHAAQYNGDQMNFGRLSGIDEKRGRIIIELRTCEHEIREIAVKIADVCNEIATERNITLRELTGNDMLDNAIKSRNGATLISGDIFKSMISVISSSKQYVEFSQELILKLSVLVDQYNALMKADKEMLAAQQEVVKFLHQHNVEDSVIANTLLKKSLRVYIGDSGVGRSILTYLISERKSRQNYNVLYIDLTGENQLHRYGINTITLDDYIERRTEMPFTVVTGKCRDNMHAQELNAILTRAADYYRVINVVISTEQQDIYDILCRDVLSVNLITNTKYRNMENIKALSKELNYENVAKRIIVNDCSIRSGDVIEYFDLLNDLSTQVLTMPHIDQIEVASFRAFNPHNLDIVAAAIEELTQYA